MAIRTFRAAALASEDSRARATAGVRAATRGQPPFLFTWPPFEKHGTAPPELSLPLAGPHHLYIHFPFCRSRCPFCFYKVAIGAPRAEIERYVDAIASQLSSYYSSTSAPGPVLTLYLGGGTPSLLRASDVSAILGTLPARPLEVTLEVEPGTTSLSKLAAYVSAGVSRFSIGVQSFSEDTLRSLGRHHTVATAVATVRDAIAVAPLSVNVDLLCDLPSQDGARVRSSIEVASTLGAEEISLYRYYAAGNSIWSRSLALPAMEPRNETYRLGDAHLTALGYRPVTTFSYTRGWRHLHRVGVWSGDSLVGVGVSAYGFVAGVSYQMESNLELFLGRLADKESAIRRAHRLSSTELTTRRLVLGLQLQHISGSLFGASGPGGVLGAELPRAFYAGSTEFELTPEGRAMIPSWLAERLAER